MSLEDTEKPPEMISTLMMVEYIEVKEGLVDEALVSKDQTSHACDNDPIFQSEDKSLDKKAGM